MNAMDLLGALMNSGMSRSGGQRIEHSMGGGGMGGAGDILGQILGGGGGSAAGSGGLMDMLGKMAGSLGQGGSRSAGGMGSAGGGGLLESLAGAMFGGGRGSTGSGAGAGGMAVLGSLALAALRNMGGARADTQGVAFDDRAALMAGLRAPANAAEEQQVLDVASLIVKAMINAAKADGRIDDAERDRIVGKLEEGGISAEERRFVEQEMRKPIDIDGLARAVPNKQVATQVYAASLLAIEVDTDQERRYLQDLAAALGLDSNAVAYLHSALGVTTLH
jgi:uncharacterized membrane protein YebE (DUF533 family)